jgi:hypothetical protein
MNAKLFSLLLLFAASEAAAQTLTARQLFYKDDAETKPAPKAPAAKAPPKPVKTAARSHTAPPPATSEVPAPAQPAPVVANAGYVPDKPLGLRYSLVKVTPDGETEVSPDETFHSGDSVRVKVEGNRDGFLYIVSRGSSGNWKPLFPSADINGGENHVAAHASYSLPSTTQVFSFDRQAGEEKLFIIYSPDPIRDLESMIPSLTHSTQPDKPATKALPIITATLAPITDNYVSQMRQAYSRDLVVETVTPKTPEPQAGTTPPKQENAVYIVNRNGGRLVADIRLEHK